MIQTGSTILRGSGFGRRNTRLISKAPSKAQQQKNARTHVSVTALSGSMDGGVGVGYMCV